MGMLVGVKMFSAYPVCMSILHSIKIKCFTKFKRHLAFYEW